MCFQKMCCLYLLFKLRKYFLEFLPQYLCFLSTVRSEIVVTRFFLNFELFGILEADCELNCKR